MTSQDGSRERLLVESENNTENENVTEVHDQDALEDTEVPAGGDSSQQSVVIEVENSGENVGHEGDGFQEIIVEDLSEHTISALLAQHGRQVINFQVTGEPGMTLFRKTVKQEELNCAKLLLDHAVEHSVTVLLEWENEEHGEFADCLQCVLENGRREGVELIMRCLSTTSSAAQNQRILKRNFQRLLGRFPDILEDYLVNNRLAFEVGTLDVPRSAFRDAQERPVAFISNTIRESSNEDDPTGFIISEDPALQTALKDTSSTTVKAVLKQFPTITVTTGHDTNDKLDDGKRNLKVLSALIDRDVPVAVFDSETVKTLVNHEWNTVWKRRLLFALINHLLATIAFTLFSSLFGVGKDGTSTSQHLDVARSTISMCFVLTITLGLRGIHPKIRIGSFCIIFGLLVYSMVHDRHTQLTAFLTSLENIIEWISVLWYLQPFKSTGPLISMVSYVLWDIAYFILLMVLTMTGFGVVFYVLFSNAFAENDEELFNSPWRSIESVFYALLGDFESSVIRSDLDGFIPFWRNVLFNVFLFLGPIVLLSLLISIIEDTYDRVKLTEDAELVKCRARIIDRCERRLPFKRMVSKALIKLKDYRGCNFVSVTIARLCKIPLQPHPLEDGSKLFYYLVPREPLPEAGTSPWYGRLRELETRIRARVEEGEERTSDDVKRLDEDIEKLEKTFEVLSQKLEAAYNLLR